MAPDEEVEEDEEEEEPAEPEQAETELAEEGVESSWEELLAKRAETLEDDDEESIFDLGRDDTVESLSGRATPPQPTEFVCSNCRLVKYKSQLADKKRNLCSDCV